MTSFTHRLAAAAACAALALPVLAQTGPAAPAAADAAATSLQQRHGHHANRADRANHANHANRADRDAKRQQWQEKRAERHAARLAEFKQSLALSAAQEPAWTRFTQALQARSTFARLDRQNMDKLTTPERIDRLRAQRAQRDAAMDARLDAAKAFYAELQPEQQQRFDAASARMLSMGKSGAQRHHHPHGGKGMRGHTGHAQPDAR